jgi:ArsR family transcriptional regulator, virulence genes transcriptional regulator
MTVQLAQAAQFEGQAAEAADVLRALANERRLSILCILVERGEASVNALAAAIGLSQSALSQHLARMRDEGLVTYRRERQTLWYRIADPKIEILLATLHRLFCATGKAGSRRPKRKDGHVAANVATENLPAASQETAQ